MTKQNQFTQHLPNYYDPVHVSRFVFEFDTTEELLAHPKLQEWALDNNFYCFSKTRNQLMAELYHGAKCYVLGFITRPDLVDLPIWPTEPPSTTGNNKNKEPIKRLKMFGFRKSRY